MTVALNWWIYTRRKMQQRNEAHIISPIPLFPLYIMAAKNNFPAWYVFLSASCHLKLAFLMSFGFMSGDAFNILLILQHKQLWHAGNSEHPQPSPPITPFINLTLQWISRENFTVSLTFHSFLCFMNIYICCVSHFTCLLPSQTADS